MKKEYINFYIFFIGFIIFQNFDSTAQENYKEGYIINKNQDTIKGYINYRNCLRNPDSIMFKTNLDNKVKIYFPKDITSFRANNEVYESAKVETEISPYEVNDLDYDKELHFEKVDVFLQVIITGKKCLYLYLNKIGKEQFYIKRDTTTELLVFKRYLKALINGDFIVENKKYVGQLSYYLQDCPEILTKLKTAKYNKKDLNNIFIDYYKCTWSSINFQEKTETLSIELGITGGIQITKIKFESEKFDYLANINFKESYNFTAGIFCDIIFPRNLKKWSLCNEITYNNYQFNGKYTDYTNLNQYTITNFKFDISYLKMNNLFRFRYPISKFSVYFNIGISNGIIIYESNKKSVESKFYSSEWFETSMALKTRSQELGYIIGLGIRYNKYFFESRYERGNGISDYGSLSSPTDYYYFLIGYRLK